MISKDNWNEILMKYIPEGHVFVEVGAYDGETHSHTCHLADSGWKGYYFEPVLEYATLCANRHKNNDVDVLPIAIGEQGIQSFHVSGELSSLNGKEYQDKVSQLEWFKGVEFTERKIVVVSPLILPVCDLLVIDVEGVEYNILKNMTIQPKIIMVELHEESKEWQNIHDTTGSVKLLEDMGYTKIYSDDIDSIFIL